MQDLHIDQRNDPFEDCCCIVLVLVLGHAEGNRKTNFKQDEGELDPER